MAWALMLLSVAGAFVLRRRRHDLLVLLAPVALVLLVAAVTYGTTRFRFAAEPSLCILAAVALVTAAGALRERLPARPVSASARG
jgi:asparagine N-glycosylation enzyme membrane subunit Stt3